MMDVVKGTTEVANKALQYGENLARKAWSILDAASEKKSPKEYLSLKAISSIQGKQAG